MRTTSISGQDQSEEDRPRSINTWFLDQPPASSSSSSSSNFKVSETNSSKPRFTRYDPLSTLPLPDSPGNARELPIAALPSTASASDPLQKLHAFLIAEEGEASDVLQVESVRVFDTLDLVEDMQYRGEGEVVRPPPKTISASQSGVQNQGGKATELKAETEIVPVEGVWRWIVVAQVRGRGRGVVARADGVIRRWLIQNPLGAETSKSKLVNPKLPRIDPDADWSIVPLPHQGICINLLTEEGRDRWRLEDMWSARG